MQQRRKTPCDNCPARTKLHRATVGGRKLDLCRECLKALRKILEGRAATDTESSEQEPAISDATGEA